jgi:hypothetical protein
MDSQLWIAGRATDTLRLPPIPHLELTPWLSWSGSAPTLKIDTLMTPSLTPSGILQTPEDRTQTKPALRRHSGSAQRGSERQSALR